MVTEFVRHRPVTGNRGLHTYTDQTDVLDNVFVDLSPGLETVWSESFSYGVRKAVKKAVQYGLRTVVKAGLQVIKSDIRIFLSIYNGTMKRNEADKFYFFNPDFVGELSSYGRARGFSDNLMNDTPYRQRLHWRSGDNASVLGAPGALPRRKDTFQRGSLSNSFWAGLKSTHGRGSLSDNQILRQLCRLCQPAHRDEDTPACHI